MPPGTKPQATDRLEDDDYPAYTMGRAAEMIGATPGFLRAIGEARLITPLRSEGGHRRYSRYQLRIAARARELVDSGTPIDAACRIIILEDQLEEALRLNEELRRNTADPSGGPADTSEDAGASAEGRGVPTEGRGAPTEAADR
ncbi:MerR family transcriptional regulator [Streptomyces sp. URMC 123]|uniref:MerR family transcriptional regulator n=1 Tax=Streptomyces sp. URMC 123 TaxID=3423403 RepID=UPI003F1B9040